MHRLLLFLGFLSFSFGAYAQSIEQDIRKEIAKILTHDVDIDPEETPGLLLGIIEVDTFFILEYGNRADGSGALGVHDVFDLGGLSKVFVSAVACSMIEQGIFSWDDRLEEDFPEWKEEKLGQISFEALLQHQSGIKKVLVGLEGKTFDGKIQENDFLACLQQNPIKSEKSFQYSHHNYALLSLWIEKRTGQSFSSLLQDFIVQQHQESNDFLSMGDQKYIDAYSGLSKAGNLESAIHYGSHEYSQGMQAKMIDLIAFTQSFWLDENNPVAQLCLDNHIETDIRNKLLFSRSFYVLQNKKYTVYTHSGRSNRHTAAIHFVPETKTGIIALSNSEIGTKDLSLLVLRMINHNWKRKPYGQEK